MALPTPNLDDRSFQDLVDEAKRMVMRRCPEWTDHNVSDPGVTLIETFAYMTDQLLYRLNRIPDRHYVKFLDLLGLRILPPTPARAPVTFWLSTPAQTSLSIPAGTQVGTVRTENDEAIVFALRDDLDIRPCELRFVRTQEAGGQETVNRTQRMETNVAFGAFGDEPGVGDVLLLGLSEAVPNCAVRLDFTGAAKGVGVNPKHPPLVWEAWTGTQWTECLVTLDETGGLNASGSIIVHLPAEHRISVVDEDRAGWLRARVVPPLEGQPSYSASPSVEGLSACTVGGTGEAINAEIVVNEVLGEAEGVAGQVLSLSARPALAGVVDAVVEVSGDDGWTQWRAVDNFAMSGPTDRHVVLDSFAGEVLFGPVVRNPDGGVSHHGAVPPKGAIVRIREYAIGGGARGNVGTGEIQTLKSSIPFVAAVENLAPAQGGVDGETLDEAKSRGPLLLRTRDRAVTAEDYEVFARDAAPELARVRCLTAGEADVAAGAVKVLVVPAAARTDDRIRFADLVPTTAVLDRIASRLDEVRLIGTRVLVEPPRYRGVTVVARLIARPRVAVDRVREEATAALYRFLDPLPGGGPDGTGWPFGRPVLSGDVYAVLQHVRGLELVEDVRLFTANPVTGERGAETGRVDVEPNSLIFSFEHKVRVEGR
ncbi:putative baseplate assembly protein [Actinokineospora alba]|uniref:Putative baseplate assembly protein n=1 Tax=Actinokineospora alba TaxID=504798 RepID=A0A1H0F5J5_9PSEU|nr:putative baseplate assembly protein [Actinokineospora alba]TDP69349.1 putative phage baseplate assembly protein [Actinokineospora alba]SDI18706.1 putative baseplate assembly protein [Actinokineospora alba]SDN89930.1 putative baseplate assembly protein [Actinokineospora alba]